MPVAPAAATCIRLPPEAGKRVRDGSNHFELGAPRPEAGDAVVQRAHALPAEFPVGLLPFRTVPDYFVIAIDPQPA